MKLEEAESFFRDLLPDGQVREAVLDFFESARKFASSLNVRDLAVYAARGPTQLILRVGPSEVIKLSKAKTLVTVHSRRRVPNAIKSRTDWVWRPTRKKFYLDGEEKESQGSFEYDFPTASAPQILHHLRELNELWIKEASPYLSKPNQPKNNPGLASYLQQFLAGASPACSEAPPNKESIEIDGNGVRTPDGAAPPFLFPEEVAKDYYEGSVERVIVNRYERDPEARKRVYRSLRSHLPGLPIPL